MSIFRFIWLGCKKATFLMTKKEEGKLTPVEKIQLKLHLGICDFCTRFQKQTKLFTKNAGDSHQHIPNKLSAEKKQAIQLLLKD